jgi:hypothetical protein
VVELKSPFKEFRRNKLPKMSQPPAASTTPTPERERKRNRPSNPKLNLDDDEDGFFFSQHQKSLKTEYH